MTRTTQSRHRRKRMKELTHEIAALKLIQQRCDKYGWREFKGVGIVHWPTYWGLTNENDSIFDLWVDCYDETLCFRFPIVPHQPTRSIEQFIRSAE